MVMAVSIGRILTTNDHRGSFVAPRGFSCERRAIRPRFEYLKILDIPEEYEILI